MSEKERLDNLFRELDVLQLLDMAKDRIVTVNKTKHEKKAIDTLFHALVEYCEWNPETGYGQVD